MLNPSIGKLLQSEESRYSIVIAVAKRAREIAEIAERENEPLVEKPVNIAMNEIAEGKFTIEHRSN